MIDWLSSGFAREFLPGAPSVIPAKSLAPRKPGAGIRPFQRFAVFRMDPRLRGDDGIRIGGQRASWHCMRSKALNTMRRHPVRTALGMMPLVLLLWFLPAMMEAWGQHWSRVDDPDRDARPVTGATLAALAVEPGMAVADVGAGIGYYSFKLARLVGPEGRVYSTDVDPFAVAALWAHRLARGASNVMPMYVSKDRLGLAADSVDRILIFNVYPFDGCRPERTRALLAEAAEALRPGGRLVIYHDWVHDESWVPPSGNPPACPQPDAHQLAELGRDRFDVVRLDENPPTPAAQRGERPGYLLVLGRRQTSR
jgi:precorrin-6B methylase 2